MAARNISEKEFLEILQKDKPVLVDYWAPWCGYCRRLGPAYDEIADRYGQKLEIVTINIDEAPQLADAERIEVIPTLVLYKQGRAVDTIVAPQSMASIETFIKQALER